jgi:hypothetical protein
MARPKTYTQDDVKRAVKGAMAAGLSITRVEIDRDSGRIVLLTSQAPASAEVSYLDEWMARRDARAT